MAQSSAWPNHGRIRQLPKFSTLIASGTCRADAAVSAADSHVMRETLAHSILSYQDILCIAEYLFVSIHGSWAASPPAAAGTASIRIRVVMMW